MDFNSSSTDVVRQLDTRLLWPFFFDRDSACKAAETLANSSIGGKSCWIRLSSSDCSTPQGALPAIYQEELLHNVCSFLFAGQDSGTCHYLKLSNDATQTWFRDLRLELRRGAEVAATLVPRIGIEVFMTPYGTGVLSITLSPDSNELSLSEVLDFNYRTSRIHKRSQAVVRNAVRTAPQPVGRPVAVSDAVAEQASGEQQNTPSDSLPLTERWGKTGGEFRLSEVVETILAPLTPLNLKNAQDSFSVYTVVRFDEQIHFESPEIVNRLGTFLSALAQIEEPMHAGGVRGQLHVTNAILNRNHWAAVGMYGAAHLVSDQAPPEGQDAHPFNLQRVHRVRDRYFIPYLLAMLQRWSLQKFVFEAGDFAIRALHNPEVDAEFQRLQRDMLRFAVDGHYSQVSSREAVHHFYRLARAGMDLEEVWRDARQAIADNHSRFMAVRQQETAERMEENTHVVASVQNKIEWVEIVIMSVYSVELIHVLHEVVSHKGVPLALVVWAFALGAGGLAAALLQPWKHWKGSQLRQFALLGALCLLPLAFLGVEHAMLKEPPKESNQTQPPDGVHQDKKETDVERHQ